MSIIERAIDKLDGVKEDNRPQEDTPREIEKAKPDRVASKATEGDSSTSSTTVEHISQAKTDGGAAQADTSLSSIQTPSGAEISSNEPSVDEIDRQDIEEKDKTNGELYIDLERLAAAGFLTPDCGITSQSEEYQQVKRRLLGNTVVASDEFNGRPNLVMVTSSVPSEGKTFTSINLAMSIAAEIDRTVLAIDTDIAKKDLTRAFGALSRPGIFDLLSDDSLDVSDVMLSTNIPNLVVIPAGLDDSVSTERLASVRMQGISAEISSRYSDRIVIYDTPPILASSASLALAPQVGQLILVVEAGKTKQETFNEALQTLGDIPITGLLLNKSKQISRNSYDYYGYYYRPSA